MRYSWQRLLSVIIKEFIQMVRDKGTLAIMIGIPLMQVVLFGFAINLNPKHLPMAILSADESVFTRDFIQGLRNSDYFKVTHVAQSEAEAEKLLTTGKVLFVLNIPPSFSRDFVRGNKPTMLLEADATDPAATGNAIAAVNVLVQTSFNYQLKGALNYLHPKNYRATAYNLNPQFTSGDSPIDLRVHARYNPAAITQYNIVPGLLGVVLTLTMVMITAVAVTRERERGTMENLLATPVQPLEVMLGKVLPYIIVGYIQGGLILLSSAFLFGVPMKGNLLLLLLVTMPFIAANLIVGLTMSTIAKNQLQSAQMATFFFLPSILLSGFMFPFAGMAGWAQWLGEILPLTHFLRVTRGILLKGNGLEQIWPDIWPIFLFLLVMLVIGINRYKSTLD